MHAQLFSDRRDFLRTMALAASGLAASPAENLFARVNVSRRFKVGGFTKPFQDLDFDHTADVVAKIGWDGIECPVRKGGQILPEKVEDDLPRLVDALKQRNLKVFSVATDIVDVADPQTERVLRTAAKVGIRVYRLGFLHYDLSRPIPEQLEKLRPALNDLYQLNRQLGICGAIENHSGRNAIGAPVWDVYELIKEFDPKYFGVCFDIGHATIEGGLDWEIQFRLIEPFLSAVYVKDFVWKKTGDQWKEDWVPLGDGMIDPRFFSLLAKSSFTGPLIQHHEYPVGHGDEMIDKMKHDCQQLDQWLDTARASV